MITIFDIERIKVKIRIHRLVLLRGKRVVMSIRVDVYLMVQVYVTCIKMKSQEYEAEIHRYRDLNCL